MSPFTRNLCDDLLEAKRSAGKCGSISLGVHRASSKLDVGWLCSDGHVSKHESFETEEEKKERDKGQTTSV